MKECIERPRKLHKKTKIFYDQILDILKEYENKYRLTVRQVYYQIVSRDILPNTKRTYNSVQRALLNMRMYGWIDWDFILDTARRSLFPDIFEDKADALKAIAYSYQKDRHVAQKYHLEVFVEKEALVSILKPICLRWQVRLNVVKGFSSVSMLHEIATRLRKIPKPIKLLYLGDHDPSGKNIPISICEFLNRHRLKNYELIEVALTKEQIEEYHLPSQPAKKSDARYKKYSAKYGEESWELDALPPNVLSDILESSILKFVDVDKYNKIIDEERREAEEIRNLDK